MPMNEFLVQVQPAYLPEQSAPAAGVYVFSYTITVTNTGEVPAQLIARHWIITNELGHVEEVRGLGVVGRQPLLQPGESFEYSSGCQLRTPTGTMRGSYLCVNHEGETFECEVPLFVLQMNGSGDPMPMPEKRILH
ncbi:MULTISPECIES: Co2+/Mg2+ efflux protein ApaG [Comamonas]|uniref:Co2+/Mg2+ efflux protein ApaG n=1 Tax=Comamonas TaxID=283 RepID=UPI0012D1B797|nr:MULTISPECIES: Co2+/Mg2+ efflux protein ApaG [Comamonas]MEB5963195.1 Co2+/Mg2+ efflux protein ApaG [Comamonas testosteroni]MPS92090.1 Co2+/Mg2+ efflux protein ApaG [Comamonas sp.]